MPGLNGLVKAYKMDTNVRAYKYTVFVKSVTNATTQREYYAAVPAGANGAPVVGVLQDHFHEDNYFIPQPAGSPGSGTWYPENVTGTTPAGWNLVGYPLNLMVKGETYVLAAVACAEGDTLVVADAYGRVEPLASLSLAPGTLYYTVGTAKSGCSNLDDLLLCDVQPARGVA